MIAPSPLASAPSSTCVAIILPPAWQFESPAAEAEPVIIPKAFLLSVLWLSSKSIGGLFGQSGNTAGKTIEKLVNTGNITLVNTNDKWKPTSAKNGYVGGIAGIDTTDIHNAYCYCTITAIDFEDSHSTESKNALGMITGSVSAAGLSNCHAGGKIIATQVEDGADASGDGAIIDTPGVLNVSNYATWISGDHTVTSETAKSQSCGYISSITATPQYAN